MNSKIQNIIHAIIVNVSIIALTTVACVTVFRIGKFIDNGTKLVCGVHNIMNDKQIHQNLKKSIGNIAEVTENAKEVTENAKEVTENIAKATENIAGVTENIAGVTENIAGVTNKALPKTLIEIQAIATGISDGLENNGGIGLMSGLPVNPKVMDAVRAEYNAVDSAGSSSSTDESNMPAASTLKAASDTPADPSANALKMDTGWGLWDMLFGYSPK